MNTVEAPRSDALRPTEQRALDAWAQRVRAYREQADRFREIGETDDLYAPSATRFVRDPRRTDDPALDELVALSEPGDRWLDIGAGAGRYALPLALHVRSVHAIDPSPSMLRALRAGTAEHEITNISITPGRWPLDDATVPRADVALMAHVGYVTEDIGPFLDAAEAAIDRTCVAIMRTGPRANAAAMFWGAIHGEDRVPLPALPELLTLLLARRQLPSVAIVDGKLPRATSLDDLITTSRRQLGLRAGSPKDQRLIAKVRASAVERNGEWVFDDSVGSVGVVSWEPR